MWHESAGSRSGCAAPPRSHEPNVHPPHLSVRGRGAVRRRRASVCSRCWCTMRQSLASLNLHSGNLSPAALRRPRPGLGLGRRLGLIWLPESLIVRDVQFLHGLKRCPHTPRVQTAGRVSQVLASPEEARKRHSTAAGRDVVAQHNSRDVVAQHSSRDVGGASQQPGCWGRITPAQGSSAGVRTHRMVTLVRMQLERELAIPFE